MKKSLIAAAIFLSGTALFAQYPSVNLLVRSIVPRGWKVVQQENSITLLRKDSVFFYSVLSASVADSTTLPALKKGVLEIKIEYGKEWSPLQFRRAKLQNDSVDKAMGKLGSKYSVGSEKYLSEREKLLARKIPVPDINSDAFSIFVRSYPERSDRRIWREEKALQVYTEQKDLVTRFYDCFDDVDIINDDF